MPSAAACIVKSQTMARTKVCLRISLLQNPDYAVGYEDGHLYLYAHTHRWEYTVTGNEVTASCTTSSPNSCGQTAKVTLTAADDTETGAQDYVYSGAHVTDTGMASTGATVGKIIYEDAAGQSFGRCTPKSRHLYGNCNSNRCRPVILTLQRKRLRLSLLKQTLLLLRRRRKSIPS